MVLLAVYKHPSVESKVLPVLNKIFFRKEFQNPFFSVPLVITAEDIQIKKDLNTEKWKYKIEDEDNLVTLLLLIKRILAGLTIMLTKTAGFFEKVKNLITWREPLRTSLFIVAGLIIYCVLSILPLRWVIIFGSKIRFLLVLIDG